MNLGRALTKKIEVWVEEGLISPYQAESIADFETKHHRVGRKRIRRTSWQLIMVFLLLLGGLFVVTSHWASWLLPVRLLVLFSGIGVFQWLSWQLLAANEPVWLRSVRHKVGMSDNARVAVGGVLLCVTATLGSFLLSQQYPMVAPLWVSLSFLVWTLLPLMLCLRSDWGLFFVGILACVGAVISPAEHWVLLSFPYAILPLFTQFFSEREGPARRLYGVWMVYMAMALWPLSHVFWYWPILGLFFYSIATVIPGPLRKFVRIFGLGLALTWAVLTMWWPAPISIPSLVLMAVLLLFWVIWEMQDLWPLSKKTMILLFEKPVALILMFLLWTVLLACLQTLWSGGHAVLMFFHAGLSLLLAVRLTWLRDRFFRGLGLSLLVLVVGILLIQPVFPTWMRGTLMITAGFGLWVFLRVRRNGLLIASTFMTPTDRELESSKNVLWWSRFWSSVSVVFAPSDRALKWGIAFLFAIQLLLIGRPVLVYEWVRLVGESYVMPAKLQDPYSPFRGDYLQFTVTDFEQPWPLVVSSETRYAYMGFDVHGNTVVPVSLGTQSPEGVYLRIPIKWRSATSTVVKPLFTRFFVPLSERDALLAGLKKDAKLQLHVKMKYGYCLLEGISVGEKND